MLQRSTSPFRPLSGTDGSALTVLRDKQKLLPFKGDIMVDLATQGHYISVLLAKTIQNLSAIASVFNNRYSYYYYSNIIIILIDTLLLLLLLFGAKAWRRRWSEQPTSIPPTHK